MRRGVDVDRNGELTTLVIIAPHDNNKKSSDNYLCIGALVNLETNMPVGYGVKTELSVKSECSSIFLTSKQTV